MTIHWGNPYSDRDGQWLKGNLHAHTTAASPCAVIPLADALAAYREFGYHFLSISDHLKFTPAAEHPSGRGLTLIPGVEWNSRVGAMPDRSITHQHHLGLYAPCPESLEPLIGLRTQTGVLDELPDDVFVVANHPNWGEAGHYDMADLLLLAERVHGMEIYNAIIEAEEGQALATAQWDRLLASGRRLLGLASDDSHETGDIGKAWIMVRAADRTPAGILRALASGNFYCSTGAEILDLGRKGDTLFLELAEECLVRVVGRAGRLVDKCVCRRLEWDLVASDSPYLRFEVQGSDWSRAWTQPFFKE